MLLQERLLAAVRPRLDELARETLAVQVELGEAPPEGAQVSETRVEGEILILGLQLAATKG